MFSKKTLTFLLSLAVIALSYQTYLLIDLSGKVAQAQVALGASSSVSFSNTGEVPDMVGGC